MGSAVWMYENILHALFGRKIWLFQWWTVAGPVSLAQASQSRLGEMKQGDFLHEISPRRLAHLLSELATRPGERDLA